MDEIIKKLTSIEQRLIEQNLVLARNNRAH